MGVSRKARGNLKNLRRYLMQRIRWNLVITAAAYGTGLIVLISYLILAR
jgi:hypothetical protein